MWYMHEDSLLWLLIQFLKTLLQSSHQLSNHFHQAYSDFNIYCEFIATLNVSFVCYQRQTTKIISRYQTPPMQTLNHLHVVPVHMTRCIFQSFFSKKFKIPIFITIFGFRIKNEFKWVQTLYDWSSGSWNSPSYMEKIIPILNLWMLLPSYKHLPCKYLRCLLILPRIDINSVNLSMLNVEFVFCNTIKYL